MLTFKIKHNYCGMETTISGVNVYDAFKKNNKDFRFWTVLSVEKN